MLIISHLFSAVISGRLSCCTARGSERHQAEVLKKFYRSLIETVRNTSPEATIMVSGLLPTYRQGQEGDACGETTLPEDAIISVFIQSGTDTTPWITERKTRARTIARTSPPPGTASPLFASRNATPP
ncbi:hypothetical protein F2P79_019959 [Pimephales promelas]|nr:hypothetical protein F2P79_019959 [Pimephales promelas]